MPSLHEGSASQSPLVSPPAPEPLFPPVMPNPLSTLGKIATGIIGFHAAILEAITQPFRSTKRNDDNSNAGNTNDKVKIISGSQLALATPFLKINSRVGVALIVVR